MSANFTPTLHEYTNLTPFRFWCQKILPLAYDDSLSYYELLCKVVDYLNKTMEDVTLSIEDVENLHTAYVALQGYVNNYFNNLDVQEEINNKLDALVADGTIHTIFTPDVMAILNVAQQASLDAIATIPTQVSTWLGQHVSPETGYVIDDTLTISGAAADAKAAGDAIGELKSDLNTKINASLTGIREYQDKSNDFIIGKHIATGAGGSTLDLNTELDGRGATRTLSYCLFDINAGDIVTFTGVGLTGGSSRPMCFVDDNGTVLWTTPSVNSGAGTWTHQANVDCKCLINCVTWNSSGDQPHIISVIKNDKFTDVETDIDSIQLQIRGLKTTDGWFNLTADMFNAGDWESYTSAFNRSYRVKTINAISFPRNVHLLAKPGFYLKVFLEDGTEKTLDCCVDIPANTNIKLYIRRIAENTSEAADIEEFASMLLVSSGLSGMEKYESTFTDVTMFPRIGISGDSYSAGGGIISGITELTWGKNLERESGVIVDIYAKSGESVVSWNTDTVHGLPALLAGEECGLYWFAHGINGTSTDAAIGTPVDMSAEPKPQTFYGQYVYAIEAVKAAFPDSRIVVATIMGTGYNLYQTKYAKVNTAIRNIAEYCEIPVVDLADDDFYKSTWYGAHHLSNHPTAMLNAGIAHANRRILAKCIMDNPNYFINYGNKYD